MWFPPITSAGAAHSANTPHARIGCHQAGGAPAAARSLLHCRTPTHQQQARQARRPCPYPQQTQPTNHSHVDSTTTLLTCLKPAQFETFHPCSTLPPWHRSRAFTVLPSPPALRAQAWLTHPCRTTTHVLMCIVSAGTACSCQQLQMLVCVCVCGPGSTRHCQVSMPQQNWLEQRRGSTLDTTPSNHSMEQWPPAPAADPRVACTLSSRPFLACAACIRSLRHCKTCSGASLSTRGQARHACTAGFSRFPTPNTCAILIITLMQRICAPTFCQSVTAM
jgi:hypothetical protein